MLRPAHWKSICDRLLEKRCSSFTDKGEVSEEVRCGVPRHVLARSSAGAAAPSSPPPFPNVGIGLLGVALAFGLTVLTMAFAIGHISGCHLNPAVSVGLWAGGRFPAGKLLPYIVAQVLGAIAAAAVLYVIASGTAGFDVSKGFASNGYGEHSPGGYSLGAGFVTEVVMTCFFLLIILGATDKRAPHGFAPIAIGLGPDADPPDQHPGDEHLGEPGAQHRVRRSSSAAGRSTSSGCSGWRRSSVALIGGFVYRWLAEDTA